MLPASKSFATALAMFLVLDAGLGSAPAARAGVTFTNVVDTTTPAPSGLFTFFYNQSAISGGLVTFHAQYGTYQSAWPEGIFVGNGGAVTPIVKLGDPAPVNSFSFIDSPTISGGTVAFHAHYSPGPLNGAGAFIGNGGALTTIAKTGDAVPLAGAPQFTGVLNPVISGGTIAFYGEYVGSSNVVVGGIFTGSGGALTTLANVGDAAPVGVFNRVGAPLLSGSTLAFWGQFNNDSSQGVFTRSGGGTLTVIAKTGDAAPVGTFTSIANPSLSGGSVAFSGDYAGGGGIFRGDGSGPLATIAKIGDAAPVGTFNSLTGPSLSGDTVAFVADYNNFANRGIFIGNGGTPTPVIVTGDSLFGSTVSFLQLDQFDLDGNQLAFNYSLSDGRTGIAIANLDAIPEPSSLVVFGWVGICLLRRRRSSGPARRNASKWQRRQSAGIDTGSTDSFGICHPAGHQTDAWIAAGGDGSFGLNSLSTAEYFGNPATLIGPGDAGPFMVRAETVAVPEPATIAPAVAVALLAILARRRRLMTDKHCLS